jgi:hypothetical protein
MTRAQRAAEKVQKERERLAALELQAREQQASQRKAIAQAEARVRLEARKATQKRRYAWGALAEDAGLFAWSDADWQAVCAVLATLAATPHPAAVLEGVLGAEIGVAIGGSLDIT